MIFIDLTPESDWSGKFSIRVDLIESIREMRGNTSILLMTNGKEYHCLESRQHILAMIEKSQQEGEK